MRLAWRSALALAVWLAAGACATRPPRTAAPPRAAVTATASALPAPPLVGVVDHSTGRRRVRLSPAERDRLLADAEACLAAPGATPGRPTGLKHAADGKIWIRDAQGERLFLIGGGWTVLYDVQRDETRPFVRGREAAALCTLEDPRPRRSG